jgi:hypothetical protein
VIAAVVFSVEDVRASSASALLASTLQRAAAERPRFGSVDQRCPEALARGYRRAGGSDVLDRETSSSAASAAN